MAKRHCPVSLMFVVSKIIENFVIKRLIDFFGKCGLFVISSVVSGLVIQLKICCNCILQNCQGSNRPEGTRVVAPDISRGFDWVTKSSLMKFQIGFLVIFHHFLVLDGFRQFQIGILKKTSVPVFLKVPFLELLFFLLQINYLPDGVICNIGIHADTTLCFKGLII